MRWTKDKSAIGCSTPSLPVSPQTSFYTELLTVAAFGVYVLIAYWGKWKTIFSWGLAAAIAGTLSIASFIIFQAPLFARGGYTGSIGGALDVTQLWKHFLPVLNFGEITLPTETLNNLWPFIVVVLIAALLSLWSTHRRTALALTLLALLPPILLTILSTQLDIFTPRYVLSVVPALILIFATFMVDMRHQKPILVGSMGALVMVAGWFVISGTSLQNYYFDPAYAKARNWPALTSYLQQNSQPDDLIIQSAADSAFGFYFHKTQSPEAVDIALPETPAQPTANVQAALENYSQEKTAIWQVGQEFPDWPNAGVVRSWLDEHMQLVLAGNPGGLNMRQYKNWQVAPDEITQTTSTNFGDVVDLVGYKIIFPDQPTGNMTVWLYWKPLKTIDAQLKVFVHLLGATNPATGYPLWTQDDRFPQNGRISSQNWSPTEIYRDIYTLPLKDVPTGTYSLEVGFYDPTTNTRLKVGDSDSDIIQSIDLK